MDMYSKEEKEQALEVIASAVGRCEKIWPKFEERASQHTLLKNRIKALYIAKALIAGEGRNEVYTKSELAQAIAPITSIIRKCEKAQGKFEEGSSHFIRFGRMIDAMEIAKAYVSFEREKR